MEAAATLVRLGQRLKDIRGSSKQREGKELLAWIEAGGINSLEAGLVAFLTAAAIQPAGSVFYSEEPFNAKPPKRFKGERQSIALELLERWNNAPLLLTKDRQLLAYYLAGAGFNDKTILDAEPAELKQWSDAIDEGTSDIAAFLQGYGDKELIDLAAEKQGIFLLFTGKDSPISAEILGSFAVNLDDFEWYLAGRGYTYDTLEHENPQKIEELLGKFEAPGPNGPDPPITSLEAFLEGYEV